ncbi:MAG: TonB-dependent receptor plug domain-containing protein [Gammaproteobacteria bacterium]|nr:TonB-dependent receptor plug domain-containing protein [Gammaproteobacteria bacterium]
MRPFFFCLLCWLPNLQASESTTSLSRYLTLANETDVRIVFSSALVRPHYLVTYDGDQPITLEKIKHALSAYELRLTGDESTGFQVSRIITNETEESADKGPVSQPSIEEVIVNSSLHEFTLNHAIATVYLDRENLTSRPAFANDAFRVSSRLPGAANNGVSSRSAIRGGLANETLIMFDGMRLYEPFHLHRFNDLFSVIDTRYISSINFITGGFPARYGDRLSGVMEIQSIAPEDIESQQQLGIGLYNASYMKRGSFRTSDYLVSIRRSTIDLIGSLAQTDLGKPAFSDLYARVDTVLDESSTLSSNLLWFGDDVSINNSSKTEQAESAYGNTYLWASLNRKPTDRISTETRLGFTAIKDDRQGLVSKPGMITGHLSDDQEFRIYHFEHTEKRKLGRALLEFGGTYRYFDAEYGYDATLDIDPRFIDLSNYPRPASANIEREFYGNQAALFASYKRAFNDALYIELGFRLDAQDYLDDQWTNQVTPRLNLLYKPSFGGELRFSLGEFYQAQGIHELDISDGIDTFQKAQESVHQIISYRRNIRNLEFRIEAYRKEAENPSHYFENLTDPFSLLPELQVDRTLVAPEDVIAQGIEVSLNAWFDNSEFWFNYTRAEVKEDVNGRTVRRSTDQKHAANIGYSRKFNHWQLSLEATYHTGWPTSVISLDDGDTIQPAKRNDRRLKHFLTVDMKAIRTWQLSNSQIRLEAGLSNLFNRNNHLGTDYVVENDQLIEKEQFSIPIAPFLDLYWTF